MKPIKLTIHSKESLFNAVKRSINQAIFNNSTVMFMIGKFSCLVYPSDTPTKLLREFKIIELQHNISLLTTATA